MNNFTVYSIDEFRTSKLNCKTEEVNENLYLPDRKNKLREMHSILTFQMDANFSLCEKCRINLFRCFATKQIDNNRMGCINRDSNAVNNMIKTRKVFFGNW